MVMLRAVAILTAIAAYALPGSTLAQAFPTKPLRVIMPTAPGGSPDIVARIVTEKAAELLGQPIVVDGRGGGGGLVGAGVAKAKADQRAMVEHWKGMEKVKSASQILFTPPPGVSKEEAWAIKS